MSLVYHERPGVYSSYDASSVIGRGTTERVIALVGKAEAKAGLYRLHSYSEAKEAFGEASELGRMAKIAYQNGAGTVLASPVAADALADYQAAFALIFAEKEASFCVAASSLETVQKALRDAALWDEVKDRLKKSALGLSGGQQQRLCIARALAVKPEVLLMDEPTSALDPGSTMKVEELMSELKKNYTVVIVTHNMQQAARISDRTAFFLLGELVEVGPTAQIFSAPQDKRTEDYISGRFG